VNTVPALLPLPDSETAAYIADTQRWLQRAVIGLNLCPFARAVHVRDQIRYVVTAASGAEDLLAELAQELTLLDQADPLQHETTLLIHPQAFADFLDFNDFLGEAEAAIAALDLEGELQVASFHPHYQFAGTAGDDIGNYTNRSPWPTLHLLREESIERALEGGTDADTIVTANIARLQQLGLSGWQGLFQDS